MKKKWRGMSRGRQDFVDSFLRFAWHKKELADLARPKYRKPAGQDDAPAGAKEEDPSEDESSS